MLKMRKEGQKLLQRFLGFLGHADTPQSLRQSCLCLQLTMIATSLSSRKHTTDPDRLPTLVLLGQQVVQKRIAEQLATLILKLKNDPALRLEPTVASLVITEIHIVARYSEYSDYPTALWLMVQAFNPMGYCSGALNFLCTPASRLDTGYSFDLWQDAWAQGAEAAAVR